MANAGRNSAITAKRVLMIESQAIQKMSENLLELGIYVIGFFFPVVPKGEARIRVQLSAAHSNKNILQALDAFEKVGKELGVIK